MCVFLDCPSNILRSSKSPIGQNIRKVEQGNDWDKRLKENQRKPIKVGKIMHAVDCCESKKRIQEDFLTEANQRSSLKTPNGFKNKQNISRINIKAGSTLKYKRGGSGKNLLGIRDERKVHLKCNNWLYGKDKEVVTNKLYKNLKINNQLTPENQRIPQSTKGNFKFIFKEDEVNKEKLLKTVNPNYITKAIKEANAELNNADKQSNGLPCLSGTFVKSLSHLLIGKQIGKGAYASVNVAFDKKLGHKVALKIYNKTKITEPQRMKNIQNELRIMQKLEHPNIVKFYTAFDTHKHVVIEMEHVKGLSLHDLIKNKEEKRLSEVEAKKILKQIVSGVEHCHNKGVSHRDIKLENLLLDENENVKIIDFGFSTCMIKCKKLKIFCGTPSYMAPEIVMRKKYAGPPADIWAMGVLTYVMLCGSFPFKGSTNKELYKKITSSQPHLPDHLSPGSKSLISRMLNVNADERPTAQEIAIDPWLVNNQYTDISPINIETIEAYHGRFYEKYIHSKPFNNTMVNPFKAKWSFATKLSNPLEKNSFDGELVGSIIKLGYSIKEVETELRNKGSHIRNLYDRLKSEKEAYEPKDALGGLMKFNTTAPFSRFIKPSPVMGSEYLQ